MTNKEKQLRINELEIWALDKYCDYNNISVSDYINASVMGDSKYIEYMNLYKEQYGECLECGHKNCNDDCPYQMYLYRIESEQTNES